jgi:phosphate starvation-inducible PhoH-like protein
MEEIIYPDSIKDQFLQLIQKNVDKIESTFSIAVALRGNKMMFDGDSANTKKFKKYMKHMFQLSKENGALSQDDVNMSLSMVNEGKGDKLKDELHKRVQLTINGKVICPKTYNQREYIKAVKENDLVFAVGPAGTGKTFLAISLALNLLFSKRVERIVLTRPVVEAGEKLGFLPGDIQQKVNPYFRPIYDALYHMIGFDRTAEMIEKEIIEIAPLAFMRGRTIDNAFIILDEGQNTLNSQMKMFLTRFGQNSKVIITADMTQIDLDQPKKSGIFNALKLLKNVKGISIIHLTKKDVIRHSLVQRIIEAYERKGDAI